VIGQPSQQEEVVGFEKPDAILERQALAGVDFGLDILHDPTDSTPLPQ
jgi:hypothetical protein